MTRRTRLLAITLASLAAVGLGTVALLNSNALRGPLERAASERLQRAVVIGGDLRVRPGWHVRVTMDELQIANPPWASRPHLLTARRAIVTVSLRSLFAGRAILPEIVLIEPAAALEVGVEGRSWDFGESDGGEPPVIGRIRIDRGSIFYHDARDDTLVNARVDAAGADAAEDVLVQAEGRYRGEPLRGEVRGPAVVRLADQSAPYPLRVSVAAGATRLEAEGTVSGLPTPDELRMQVRLVGNDLAALRGLAGFNVPATPPYALEGLLSRDAEGWRLTDARGEVGDSDVAGHLSYRATPRPTLRAEIVSNVLDINDLGPLIGASPGIGPRDTASPEQRRRAQESAKGRQALPTTALEGERLRDIDVDVTLEAREVRHPPALPVETLSARVRILDGTLRIEPLAMKLAGGRVEGVVILDARQSTPRGRVDLRLQSLRLGRLFPTVEAMRKATGVAHGRIVLAGSGASVAALLGTADGSVTLAVDGGRVSNLVLEAIGLDAGEALALLAGGDRNVALRCAVVDLDVRKGIATSNALVVDTEDTLVIGAGAISFADERLDFTLYPQPKDRSVLAARVPLHIRGSFRDPDIFPDAKALAVRGAAAGLLALINPLLALASLIETGPGKDSNCGNLLTETRARQGAAPRG